MFYRKEDNGNWLVGSKIKLPTGEILSIDNKEQIDDWFWYDEVPLEYLEWLETSNLKLWHEQ